MRRIYVAVLSLCVTAAVLVPTTDASATIKRTATMYVSKSTVHVGTSFAITGRITNTPRGTSVRIERKVSGSSWRLIKTVRTTNARGNYAWRAATLPRAATFSFRTRVLATRTRSAAVSPVRTVRGTWAPGTIQNPYTVGQPFRFGNWRFNFQSTDTDAWPEIAAENMFNEAPAEGWSYITVPVTFTHLGADYEDPFWDTWVDFVGNDGRVYDNDTAGGWCGVVPSSWTEIGDLYTNGSGTGNVCASVPTSAISGGKWRVRTWDTSGYRHVRIG